MPGVAEPTWEEDFKVIQEKEENRWKSPRTSNYTENSEENAEQKHTRCRQITDLETTSWWIIERKKFVFLVCALRMSSLSPTKRFKIIKQRTK